MSTKGKESRSQALPVLNPEPPLLPDHYPIILGPNPPEPIDVQELITRCKLKLSPPRSSTPLKRSIARSEADSYKEKSQQPDIEKERLFPDASKRSTTHQITFTEQQHTQLQNDYRALKQNYDELARRYHEGEQAFFHLKAKCEYLESELKIALDQPFLSQQPNMMTFNPARLQQELTSLRSENSSLQTSLTLKQSELKSALSQLRLSNDELERLRAAEEQTNAQSDRKEHRKTTQLANYYNQGRLTSELARISEESAEHRLKTDNQRLVEEIAQFQHEYTRLKDDNLRLKNELVMLRSDLTKKESYKAESESIARQLANEKQGHQFYTVEVQRLKGQLAHANELLEQERKQFEEELVKKELTRRSEHSREARPPNIFDKTSLQQFAREKEDFERALQDLNLQLTFQRSKVLRLQTELSKAQEELQKLRDRSSRSRNQSTEKKFTLQRFSEDSREMEADSAELARLREQVKWLHSHRQHQDAQLKKLHEELLRTRLEVSVEHSQENLLKKQLDLSVKEMKHLGELARENSGELMHKIVLLYTERQELEKKSQCQQFELNKLYEVLQTRREELEQCYRTIDGLRKGISAPLQPEELDELLRTRRDRSPC